MGQRRSVSARSALLALVLPLWLLLDHDMLGLVLVPAERGECPDHVHGAAVIAAVWVYGFRHRLPRSAGGVVRRCVGRG